MTYTLFSGCSFTAGSGFSEEKNESGLWVNLLHSQMFSHTTKLNTSKGGRSNAEIFQDTVKNLLTYQVEYAIVQWTSPARFNIELGFELYDTFQSFMPNSPCRAHNLNDINYSAQYLNSIRDRFTTLVHDCYEICNLVEYVNTIIKLAQITNTRVFFVNGLGVWDKNFFDRKTNILPSQYTEYTQQILNSKNRDDKEVYKLYEKMHNKYDELGGINESLWLNLYCSMKNHQTDANDDKIHPGIDSNRRYFKLFSNSLREKINQY
jgi:hypothetical protein